MWRAGDVKTPPFTVRMKQIGYFYARPPCTLRPGGVFLGDWDRNPPPLEEAWSIVLKFSPVRSSLQKTKPHTSWGRRCFEMIFYNDDYIQIISL